MHYAENGYHYIIYMCTRVQLKITSLYVTGKDDSLRAAAGGLTHAITVKLLEGLESRSHHLYTDNYYSSHALFTDLLSKGFGACGTVRVDRRGVSTEMRQHLQRGDVITAKAGSLLALKWIDKRAVTMLLSIHDSSMVAKQRRSRAAQGDTEDMRKPTMIEEYNKCKGELITVINSFHTMGFLTEPSSGGDVPFFTSWTWLWCRPTLHFVPPVVTGQAPPRPCHSG